MPGIWSIARLKCMKEARVTDRRNRRERELPDSKHQNRVFALYSDSIPRSFPAACVSWYSVDLVYMLVITLVWNFSLHLAVPASWALLRRCSTIFCVAYMMGTACLTFAGTLEQYLHVYMHVLFACSLVPLKHTHVFPRMTDVILCSSL